ncbi:MAG: long-chain fatty acid--CoA ligase [Ignavibacteriae bacterium]|nr:long-chain fatty acid--CoA ligase [Ignavibacteriota bacterium]
MPVVEEFSTIPEMFLSLTARYAHSTRPMLMAKKDGEYRPISYQEVRRAAELTAFGLAALGIERGDRVSIIAENRPEWVYCDQAIAALGAISVPVYPTMTAKQNEYIFNDADVKAVFVSNQFQLTKVLKSIDSVPTLKHVIVMNEYTNVAEPQVMSYADLLERGKEFSKQHPDHVSNATKRVKPDDLLTLIYTSGTTGNPKGVMLTQSNLCTNVRGASSHIRIEEGDVLLSFLPLSHSFERMAGNYTALACGATVAYAESIETVQANLIEVRPTIVTTVPRLFERMHSRIMKQVSAAPMKRQKIFFWSIATGKAYAAAKKAKRFSPMLNVKHAIADKLVLSKIREKLGGRMKFMVSGGAALPKEFGDFFEAIGIVIIEGYGLTETSPVISANKLEEYKFGTVGRPIPHVEVKIAHDGEILARGPNIMKGYWKLPEMTTEVIDKDGWLHTGDIGKFDNEGFLRITDRKKHLFVSSGGKNIAPQPIENLFLASKYIEQFVLIGDRRMFCTALVVPDFDSLKAYADEHGIPYTHNHDLVQHPEVNELIEKDIDQIQKDLANFERVRKFILLSRPFTIEEGELTPTQKIRRKVVEEKYAELIDTMYQGIN